MFYFLISPGMYPIRTIRNRVCFCKYINFSAELYRGGVNKIGPINSTFELILTIFSNSAINDYSLSCRKAILRNECK